MPAFPELEELKTSAVAVALTLLPLLPHRREKNVGKFERVTCAVTSGFTPKAAGMPEQSGDGEALAA